MVNIDNRNVSLFQHYFNHWDIIDPQCPAEIDSARHNCGLQFELILQQEKFYHNKDK